MALKRGWAIGASQERSAKKRAGNGINSIYLNLIMLSNLIFY